MGINRNLRRQAQKKPRQGVTTSVDEALNLALQHHRSGRVGEALALYRQVLALRPKHPDALHMAGVALYEGGDLAAALSHVEAAVAEKPEAASFHNSHGLVLNRLGKCDAAVAALRTAVTLQPDLAEAHRNLGCVLLDLGRAQEAVDALECAVRLRPGSAEALNNLGIALFRLNRFTDALEALAGAITARNDYAQAYFNIGTVLSTMDRHSDACVYFRHALTFDPAYAEAWNGLGLALLDLDQPAEAEQSFAQSLHFRPQAAGVHCNMGIARLAMGDREGAAQHYMNALRLAPDTPDALCNLGSLRALEGKVPEAVELLERAITLAPDKPVALAQLGDLRLEMARYREGIALYQRALTLAPHDAALRFKYALHLPPIPASKAEIAESRERMVNGLEFIANKGMSLSNPYTQVSQTTFYLAYHGVNDRPLQQAVASAYQTACPDLAWEAPHCRQPIAASERIRVGFLSSNLYAHTIGKFNLGIIEHLDRTRFHVTAIRPAGKADKLARAIDAAADAVIDLPTNLAECRATVARQELQVLFYPDIGMDPLTYFLAFARLAPVQAVSWGHPITTGIPNIDYFVSAASIEPDDAVSHYSERLIRLHNLPTYYHPPKRPTSPGERSEFGLPADARLYVCPQSLFKFHPDFDPAIAAILRADSKGLFVMMGGRYDSWRETILRRFEAAMPDVVDRIVFLPRIPTSQFLRLLEIADVLLDPPAFGGGNTSYEAFAMGTPIVTWPGPFMRGRVTLGCYREMGIDDLIVGSAEDYVRLALRLANDHNFRNAMSAKIKERSHVLYENHAVITELEDFFVAAVQAAANGTKL